MSDIQEATHTNQGMRRCLRDLVALAALPAIWIGQELSRVADSLADVLLTMLDLELVFIRIEAADNSIQAQTARGKKSSAPIDPLFIRQFFESILADESLPPVFDHPNTGLPLHAAVTRFGYGGQSGILVTAASRENFPDEAERLLLGLAANHAAVLLARKQAEAAQQKALAEAEAANQAKDNFLGILSHELRTPMTPVLLTVSMLQRRNDLPPDVIDDLNSIQRNVELEAKLIDDLLDLTRITRGKFQLNLQTADIHLIIRSAIEICRKKTGPRILTDLDAQHYHVSGDPARLQQIIWNLLNNANKFTPPDGSITIRSRNDPAVGIIIDVTDTGIGIDPKVVPRIFNAFEQGEPNTARRYGGLGLGLAISKALADAQQIYLSAFSRGAGHGATFTLKMSSVPSPQALRPDLRSPGPAAPTCKMLRVLLVEDHEPTHRVLGKLLNGLGHSTQIATSVQSALQIAQSADFDLVISDLGLPDGTGHVLMRALKDRFGLQGIALSGYGADGDIRKSFDAGFFAHLTKPIDICHLEDAIARASATVATSSNNQSPDEPRYV